MDFLYRTATLLWTHVTDWVHKHFLKSCSQVNAKEHLWRQVNIGSGNCLMLSLITVGQQATITRSNVYPDLCRHMTSHPFNDYLKFCPKHSAMAMVFIAKFQDPSNNRLAVVKGGLARFPSRQSFDGQSGLSPTPVFVYNSLLRAHTSIFHTKQTHGNRSGHWWEIFKHKINHIILHVFWV